jgi:hypothetical protein
LGISIIIVPRGLRGECSIVAKRDTVKSPRRFGGLGRRDGELSEEGKSLLGIQKV